MLECTCGFTRELIDAPPASFAVRAPTTLYPWFGRSLVIVHVLAYLAAAGAVIRCGLVIVTYIGAPAATKPDVIATFGSVLGNLIAGAITFILALGLKEAGLMLQAIHRRVSVLDERDRVVK